jgi:hypothetical protein
MIARGPHRTRRGRGRAAQLALDARTVWWLGRRLARAYRRELRDRRA